MHHKSYTHYAPYTHYRYGDVRAATEQWPNLVLYMEYLDKLPTVNTTGLVSALPVQ
jgi:hypothetical protein